MHEKDRKSDERLLWEVSFVSVAGNTALSGFKLLAGILGHSGAMISDAVHSLSDVITTFIAFIGVKLGGMRADREHPWGHERLECIASFLLGLALAVTGAGIGAGGIKTLISGESVAAPGILPLIAAAVSIVTKEAMYHYTKLCARKLHSSVVMADAWHHRSDALSSIGALLGILGARLGFYAADSIASLVICGFILKVAYDIVKDALSKMTDSACPEEYEERMRTYIRGCKGVIRIDALRTRRFGEKVYAETEIAVDGDLPLTRAHDIAEEVHESIEKNFPEVKHISVHVNPDGK